MYRLCTHICIIVLCTLFMVKSIPVSVGMVACILAGIVICTGANVINIGHKDTLADVFTACYILVGVMIEPIFYMLPYAAMPVWKKKYRLSKISVAAVALRALLGVIVNMNNRLQGGFITDYGLHEIAEIGILTVVAVVLSYSEDRLNWYEEQFHHIMDESTEHDILMKQINNQLIETQNARIYNATLKERNRIAKEIHDNVGHMITRSILQVGAIGIINKDADLKTPITELKNTLDTAMDSMRKSVHDLHDESIDLKLALQQLEPTAKAMDYVLEYDCENEVPRNIKYAFISIATEAVNNAVKYSSGDRIDVVVREHPGFYQLQIMDNGMTDEAADTRTEDAGIGIQGIKERVSSIGGTLKIDRQNGFKIFVTVMKK